MKASTALAAAVIVAAAMYYAWPSEGATAGDDESNNILDAVDTMTSKINGGWPSGSAPYEELITWAAGLHGVPVLVLAWLLWKESRFLPEVISGAKRSRVGALGIAQFMPATAREELGSEAAALDPQHAVPGAARYLAKLYRSTGTWTEALAAYNWGIGNVQRKGLAAAPAETRDYYTVIMNRAGEYV
ncbi:lytic transglycosylase domain-containing protein [Massilia sp. DD77]|uniref:lytic transglycosylase domain-containing protein n=1 Tax=Massilia sp. DD77 TaxID=3109349 RepID=UPI002FFEA565